MNQSYAWRTRMSDWVSTNSSTSRQNCKNQIECLGYSKTSKDKQNPIDRARTGPASYLSSDVFSEMSPVLEPVSPKLRNLRTTMATTRNMKTPLNGNTIWCVICHTIRMYSFFHIQLWIFVHQNMTFFLLLSSFFSQEILQNVMDISSEILFAKYRNIVLAILFYLASILSTVYRHCSCSNSLSMWVVMTWFIW